MRKMQCALGIDMGDRRERKGEHGAFGIRLVRIGGIEPKYRLRTVIWLGDERIKSIAQCIRYGRLYPSHLSTQKDLAQRRCCIIWGGKFTIFEAFNADGQTHSAQ